MDNFSFINLFIDRMIAALLLLSQNGFKQLLSESLMMNIISTYTNWVKNFSVAHFLLIQGYKKYYLRKDSVIAPFVEWFKTFALRISF